MKRTILFLTVFTLFFYSCKEEDKTGVICCGFRPVIDYFVYLEDINGNNLLSTDVENAYKHSEISYYYKNKDGDEIPANNNFKILEKKNNEYLLHLELFPVEPEEKIEPNLYRFYLQLNETEIDTIDLKIESLINAKISEIWYNGEKVWSDQTNTDQESIPTITIVKDITETTEETEVE